MSDDLERRGVASWTCMDCLTYVVGDHDCPVSGKHYRQTLAGTSVFDGVAKPPAERSGPALTWPASQGTMSQPIKPALSAEEWAAYRVWKDAEHATDVPPLHIVTQDFSSAGEIAVHNDLLPDSDPRKITREMIANLRECSGLIVASDHRPSDLDGYIILLREIAGALESYLPPA